MDLNKPDEMRIRIKFNPTVTVTKTDFVKPSLGVFMSEVGVFFVSKAFLFNYHSKLIFGSQVGGAMGLWLGIGIVQVFIVIIFILSSF